MPDELRRLAVEPKRCPRCRRVHPGGRADAEVRWCDGVLRHAPRWLLVELEPQAVAA